MGKRFSELETPNVQVRRTPHHRELVGAAVVAAAFHRPLARASGGPKFAAQF
jgi:hypothetical protein